jgi:hypothetical protein
LFNELVSGLLNIQRRGGGRREEGGGRREEGGGRREEGVSAPWCVFTFTTTFHFMLNLRMGPIR